MSTKRRLPKIVGLVLLFFLFSLFLSLLRRGVSYFRLRQELVLKKAELKKLEAKNEALKFQLNKVDQAKFVHEQARELLGVSTFSAILLEEETPVLPTLTPTPTREPANWEKWRKLIE